MIGHAPDAVPQCHHTWLDTSIIWSHRSCHTNLATHDWTRTQFTHIWPRRASYGRMWPHMATVGRIWEHLAAYARICPHIWLQMAAYDRIWPNIAAYGGPLGTSGGLWLPFSGPWGSLAQLSLFGDLLVFSAPEKVSVSPQRGASVKRRRFCLMFEFSGKQPPPQQKRAYGRTGAT